MVKKCVCVVCVGLLCVWHLWLWIRRSLKVKGSCVTGRWSPAKKQKNTKKNPHKSSPPPLPLPPKKKRTFIITGAQKKNLGHSSSKSEQE